QRLPFPAVAFLALNASHGPIDPRSLDDCDALIQVIEDLPVYAIEGERPGPEESVFLERPDASPGNLAGHSFRDEAPPYCVFTTAAIFCACHTLLPYDRR